MESHDLIFSCAALGGDRVRVIIVDDTISLPYQNWSHCGYGAHISIEWMLGQCPHKLPGSKATRRALAGIIVGALEEAARRNRAAFAEMNTAVGQLVDELTEATTADLPLCRKCDAPLDGGDPDSGLCALHLTEQIRTHDADLMAALRQMGVMPGTGPKAVEELRARRNGTIERLFAEAEAKEESARLASEKAREADFFSFARKAGLVGEE